MRPRLDEKGWGVRQCINREGHITSYDVCHPSEPNATGVAVVASVYEGENIARSVAALPELLAAVDALLDGPASLNASLKKLRTIRAKIGGEA